MYSVLFFNGTNKCTVISSKSEERPVNDIPYLKEIDLTGEMFASIISRNEILNKFLSI
jgi:hypothetical protein